MFTKQFWLDAVERAIRTAAQAAIGVLGVEAVGVLTTDWQGVTLAAIVAAIVSVLTSMGGSQRGDPDTATLITPPVELVPDGDDLDALGDGDLTAEGLS